MIKYAIVGLSGKRGSGKDALSSKLIPLGWERVSFADELKKKSESGNELGNAEPVTTGEEEEQNIFNVGFTSVAIDDGYCVLGEIEILLLQSRDEGMGGARHGHTTRQL